MVTLQLFKCKEDGGTLERHSQFKVVLNKRNYILALAGNPAGCVNRAWRRKTLFLMERIGGPRHMFMFVLPTITAMLTCIVDLRSVAPNDTVKRHDLLLFSSVC
jgi:hypothetical protein